MAEYFLELLWKEEDSALPQIDGIGRVRGNTLLNGTGSLFFDGKWKESVL